MRWAQTGNGRRKGRLTGGHHRLWAGWLAGLLIALAGTPAGAQEEPAPSPPEAAVDPAPASAPAPVAAAFRSPAATIETFMRAMDAGDRDRAVECMDLSLVSEDGAIDRAQELYFCLNRIENIAASGEASLWDVRVERIGDRTAWTYFPLPVPTDRYLTLREQDRFEEVARLAPEASIVLVRDPRGAWRFSAETVQGSREFWETLREAGIEPFDPNRERFVTLAVRLESLWPAYFVDNAFLSLAYWQWITLFIVVVLGIVLDFTVRFVLAALSRHAIRRRGADAKRETMRKTVRPFGLTAAAILWFWAVRLLNLPDPVLNVLLVAVRFFAMLTMVWSAFRVTDLLGEVAASKAKTTDTKFDDLLVPLVRKVLKVFIAIFGLIYIADSLDVEIAPLLTGLGIGGVGFAFAAKDTLEHLFGSVTVIADRPFEVGDWIAIGDTEGTVETLGFRSTRVRTFYNSLVTIPNGNLVRATVDNFGRRKYRRWKTHLNLTYDTRPDRLEAFCEGIREIIRLHPYTRKDYYQVWLHQFGPHSIDVLVYMFFQTPDWNTELRERHRFMIDILRLADRLRVEFAFPTQTLHVHQPEDGANAEPAPPPAADTQRRAWLTGRRAVRALTAEADWRREKPGPCVIQTDGGVIDEEHDDDGSEGTQIESKIGGSA